MNLEGRVSIDVKLGGAPAVQVCFTEPGDVARVLEGKTPGEAQAIVPVLFALCGKAQSHAARLALDAAEGRSRERGALAALQCLTEMESLRENSLRIARDWAHALGERTESASLRELMRFVPDLEAAMDVKCCALEQDGPTRIDCAGALRVIDHAESWLTAAVFGEPVSYWRTRRDREDIVAWAALQRTSAARLINRIQTDGQAEAGAIDVCELRPVQIDAVRNWLKDRTDGARALPLAANGEVPETTALSRHAADPLLRCRGEREASAQGLGARMTARLIELSELPNRMRDLIDGRTAPSIGRALAASAGMSEITAARGTLIHAVALEGGRIAAYRVLSPTRWNFDAKGVAARAVGNIVAAHPDDVQVLTELMVNAIDPCVAYSVRVH